MLVKSLSQLQILPHMSVHFRNWDFALVSWLSQKNLSIYRHFKKTQKWYALYNTVATVTRKLFFVVWHSLVIYFFLQMMDMSDSQLVIIGIKCVQKKLQNVGPMSLSKDQTDFSHWPPEVNIADSDIIRVKNYILFAAKVQDLSRRIINSTYKDVFLSPKSTLLIKHKPLFFTKPCQINNFFSTVHVV